jgi:hypothetical protein
MAQDPQLLSFFFPLKMFRSVEAEGSKVTIAFNELVKDVNAAFLQLGFTASGFVTMKQLRKALQNQGTLVQISSQIPGDVTNDVNICWNGGNTTTPGDPLYNFIQTTLGYTPAQMTTLMTLAGTFPP